MNFPVLWVRTLKLKEFESLAQDRLGRNGEAWNRIWIFLGSHQLPFTLVPRFESMQRLLVLELKLTLKMFTVKIKIKQKKNV